MKRILLFALLAFSAIPSFAQKTTTGEYLPGQFYRNTYYPQPETHDDSAFVSYMVFTNLPDGAVIKPTIPDGAAILVHPCHFTVLSVLFITPEEEGSYYYELYDLLAMKIVLTHNITVTKKPSFSLTAHSIVTVKREGSTRADTFASITGRDHTGENFVCGAPQGLLVNVGLSSYPANTIINPEKPYPLGFDPSSEWTVKLFFNRKSEPVDSTFYIQVNGGAMEPDDLLPGLGPLKFYGGGFPVFAQLRVTFVKVSVGELEKQYCTDTLVEIPFKVEGANYEDGNVFTAQISDAEGKFDSPVNIGTSTETSSGIIKAKIPVSKVPEGKGYRIRIISTMPKDTTEDNGTDIKISHCNEVEVVSEDPYFDVNDMSIWKGTIDDKHEIIKICADGSKVTNVFFEKDSTLYDKEVQMQVMEDPDLNDTLHYGWLELIGEVNHKVRFVYHHPSFIDFNFSKMSINFQINVKNDNIEIDTIPVNLYRAPVLFVHGFASGAEIWKNMRNNLSPRYPDKSLLFSVDYTLTSFSSFSFNSWVVPLGIEDLLTQVRAHKFSAGRVDVVGHSMGGLLPRAYIEELYGVVYNHDINKLVTINSLHSGAKIANYLVDHQILAHLLFGFFQGALKDFRVDNATIDNELNGNLGKNPVPSASITTTYSSLDIIKNNDRWFMLLHLVGPDVYKPDANDIVVDIYSQVGGISQTHNVTNQWHGGSTENAGVISLVDALLNRPSYNSSFFSLDGFHPGNIDYNSRAEQPSNANIKIEDVTNGQAIKPGMKLNFDLKGAGYDNTLVIGTDNSQNSSSIDTTLTQGSFSLPIPENAYGKFTIVTLGYDSTGVLCFDTAWVNVVPDATVTGISVSPADTLFIPGSHEQPVYVTAHFTDSIDRDISADTSIQYIIENPGIVKHGVLNAFGGLTIGLTNIKVKFKGFEASVMARVFRGDLPDLKIKADPGNSITQGTKVIFTALSVNGGNEPVFEWKKNGVVVGADTSIYTDSIFANGDVITCTLTNATTQFSVTDSVIMNVTMNATAFKCSYNFTSFTPASWVSVNSQSNPVAVKVDEDVSIDDNNYPNIPVGFDFKYNGNTYSTFGINSNGFIWFGSGVPATNTYTPIARDGNLGGSGVVTGIVSALGNNLEAHPKLSAGTPNIAVRTSGTAPNRTCTIQWEGFKAKNAIGVFSSFTNINRLDCKIILYENSNNIEIVLRDQNPFLTEDTGRYQIGLRGATDADFQNRSQSIGNWTITSGISTGAAGVSDTSNCRLGHATYISGNIGLRYAANSTPVISPASPITSCGSATLTSTFSPNYQWQQYGNPSSVAIAGATSKSYTALTPGYYNVMANISAACKLVSAPVAVIINSGNPVITGPASLCKGSSITLGVGTHLSYQWSTAETTETISVSAAATYSVTVNDGGGCTGNASKTITETQSVFDTTGAVICEGESYNFHGTAYTTGGTYTIVLGSLAGCDSSLTLLLTVNPLPVISAGAIAICKGTAGALLATGATTYSWSPAQGLNTTTGATVLANPGATTTYTITGTGACTSTTTAVVTVTPLPVVTATAGTGAAATQITAHWNAVSGAIAYYLDVSVDNNFSAFVTGYNNLDAGMNTFYNVTGLAESKIYYYRVRVQTGCGTSVSSNTISYATATSGNCPPLLAGNAVPSRSVICPGASQTLTLTGANGINFQWQVSADNILWQDVPSATATELNTPTGNATAKRYYRCVSGNGCYNASSTTAVVEVGATPVIKTDAVTATTATISWVPFAPGQYNISWSGAGIGNVTGAASSPYTITGLTPNTDLQVTVSPASPVCNGVNTAVANIRTLCGVPAVISLSATSIPVKGFTIKWDPIINVNTYRVYYRNLLTAATWSYADTTDGAKTVTGLLAGQTYAVYVVAGNCPVAGSFGEASAVNYITINPKSACTPLPVVSALSNCPNQVSVNISGGTAPYQVTIRRISPAVSSGSTFIFNTQQINITVGSQYAGSVWEIFARATCGATPSAISNVTMVTVKPGCPVVANLVLSAPGCNGFTASWNSNDCQGLGIMSYQLLVKKSGTTAYTSYAGLDNHKIVTGLTPGVTYNAVVQAVACNGSASGFVATETITLPVCRLDESIDAEESTSAAIDAFTIYPNPAGHQFFIELTGADASAGWITVEVINQLGQVMITNLYSIENGYINQMVSIPPDVAAGIYFVRVSAGNSFFVKPLVITKPW